MIFKKQYHIPGVTPADVYYGADSLYRDGETGHYLSHFGGLPDEYPERYEKIKSANIVDKENTPPMVLIYAGNDHYVPEKSIKTFIDVINEQGITNKVVEVPFSDHVFNLMPGVIGAQIYEQISLQWFEQYMNE